MDKNPHSSFLIACGEGNLFMAKWIAMQHRTMGCSFHSAIRSESVGVVKIMIEVAKEIPGAVSFKDAFQILRWYDPLMNENFVKDLIELIFEDNNLILFDVPHVVDYLCESCDAVLLKRVINLYHPHVKLTEDNFIKIIRITDVELIELVITLIPPDTYLKFRVLCEMITALSETYYTASYKSFIFDTMKNHLDSLKRKSIAPNSFDLHFLTLDSGRGHHAVKDGDLYRALKLLGNNEILIFARERYPEEFLCGET